MSLTPNQDAYIGEPFITVSGPGARAETWTRTRTRPESSGIATPTTGIRSAEAAATGVQVATGGDMSPDWSFKPGN